MQLSHQRAGAFTRETRRNLARSNGGSLEVIRRLSFYNAVDKSDLRIWITMV